MKPTFLRVGVPKNKAKPPMTVRAPTEPKQASFSNWATDYRTESSTGGTHETTLSTFSPGDLVMIWAEEGNAVSTGDLSIDESGWTTLSAYRPNSQAQWGYVFYKVMTSSDASTINWSNVDGRLAIVMHTVRGNGFTFTAPEVEHTRQTSSKTAPDTPSITPSTGAGTYAVFSCWMIASSNIGASTVSTPTGYTLGAEVSVANSLSPAVGVAYASVDITTSEDPDAWSIQQIQSLYNEHVITVALLFEESVGAVASGGHTHPSTDQTSVLVPLSTTLAGPGDPDFVWDDNDELVMTEVPA